MQTKTFLSAALAVAAASAQSMNATNLTTLIAGNTNLSALGTLLSSMPDLTASLANRTNITLFAPSNQALSALNSTMAGALSTNAIMALLEYHVLNGTYYASNISATPQFPHTLLNDTTYSNVTGGQVVECRLEGMTAEIISGLKSVANVTDANLNITNGVVHVIDSVLVIPTNASSVATAANLTAFNGLLRATNLTDTLDALSDVTIFAPSNSAFQDIATGLSNLTSADLMKIAEAHVVNGSILYSSSLSNVSVPSLGGSNLTVTVEDSAIFVNQARVINADILISGGVLHIIDSVINPNSTNTTANATASSATNAFSGASSAAVVPLTSGEASPTTTVAALVTTIQSVATDYTTVYAGGGAASTGGAGAASSSKSKAGAAAMATGAFGAAALFGGAAFMAGNL